MLQNDYQFMSLREMRLIAGADKCPHNSPPVNQSRQCGILSRKADRPLAAGNSL